jgi:hypothetical protein
MHALASLLRPTFRRGNRLARVLVCLAVTIPAPAAQVVLPMPPEERAQAELEVPVPGPIALVGGQVYSMDGGLEALPATVLVRGGRIEALLPAHPGAPSQDLPADARVIDVTGLFLVPGLIDAAISYDPEHDALYVTSSVTTVRDTGNDVARLLIERLPPSRARTPGPALLMAGPILDSSTATSSQALLLSDGPTTRERLGLLFETMDERARALGLAEGAMRPDFLCFQPGLQPAAWRALIEVAHGPAGLAVWGPVPTAIGRDEFLASGQDGLLGLQILLPPGVGWHEAAQTDLQPGLKALAAGDISVIPLLGVFARMLQNLGPKGEEALGLALLAPTYERLWRQEALVWEVQRENNRLNSLTTRALASQRRALLELWRAGVALVPGSASPNPWIPPGVGLVQELQQWVRAGIPPLEVLRLATSGAAQQIAPDRGSIAVGQVADLVVLASDPAKGLGALREPHAVILRGRHLDRAALQALRSQLLARQDTVRARLRQPLEVTAPELPEGDVVLTGLSRKLAYGSRISAERFAVVRTYDGGVAFATHQVMPGPDGAPASDLYLTQFFREGKLQSFRFRVSPRSGEDEGILAEGTRVGRTTRMSIRRRNAQGIVDTQTAQESLTLVDGSDILNTLIVGQFAPLGPFYTLTLEGPDLAPTVDRWHLRLHPDDHGLHVTTRSGRMAFPLESNGIPVTFQRRVGSGITELDVTDVQTFGGPGLVPASERVFVPPQTEHKAADPVGTDDD